MDPDQALTEKIIGLPMKVHRTLGPGFLQSVYLNALACALRKKETSSLSKSDEVQVVNHLTATNHDVGLLVNFGAGSLQFERKHRRLVADPSSVDLHHQANPV